MSDLDYNPLQANEDMLQKLTDLLPKFKDVLTELQDCRKSWGNGGTDWWPKKKIGDGPGYE